MRRRSQKPLSRDPLLPPPKYMRPGPGRTSLPLPLSVILNLSDPDGALRSFVSETLGNTPGLPLVFPGTRRRRGKTSVALCLTLKDGRCASGTGKQALEAGDRCALERSFGQGYVLRVDARMNTLAITGASVQGLRYGLLTLRQWLRPLPGGGWLAPDVHIRDYPDFEYRSLDWLLNAEANRWCYDWGDGRAAFVARVQRAMDRAHALKINMIQFDGIGWDVRRFPSYARLMRSFNAYARERGIVLVFGGYGGGYGATYQRQFQRQGRYWGQAFQNRRVYPSGALYPCMGMGSTHYPQEAIEHSRTLGTCLSNKTLRALKIKELVTFVRRIEPGALYIHDIDSGDYTSTARSWKMRCDACRTRWPNDTLEAPDGAAGAYADWFTQVRRALSTVRNPSGYAGEDCLTLFVGPLYTQLNDDDRTWQRECAYFKHLSAGSPTGRNIIFLIREQVLRQAGGACRTRQMSRILAPRGHGCATHCYAGGDLYVNDHLFTPIPALARWFAGSRLMSFSQGHVHQDALQALDATYLWNANAPGACADPDPALARPLDPFVRRYPSAPFKAIFDGRGHLDAICRSLYGVKAARPMMRFHSLMSRSGYGPTAILWFPFTRRLWNGESLFEPKYAREWRERLAINTRALTCVTAALPHVDDAQRRQDLEWLLQCLAIATCLLRILVAYGASPIPPSAVVKRAFLKDHGALAAQVGRASRFDFTDPLGGDVGTWRPAVELLKERFLASAACQGGSSP